MKLSKDRRYKIKRMLHLRRKERNGVVKGQRKWRKKKKKKKEE